MGDLSVTALYTSEAWVRGRLPSADLFAMPEARGVFDATNAALKVAGVFRKDLPNLFASLLQRHVAIDRIAEATGASTVIELAAGFSARGARFSARTDLRYVEVDQAHVLDKKCLLLQRSDEGKAILGRTNWVRRAGDATHWDPAWHAGAKAPLLVIAEGLLMYLAKDARRAVFQGVFAAIAGVGGGTFVFDLVPSDEEPPRGKVGGALDRAMRMFTGGEGFVRDATSRASLQNELKAAGFSAVQVKAPADVLGRAELPHADERTKVVLFVATV